MGTNAKQQNYFTSVWVEVKATKGIVTKRDEQALLNQHFVSRSKKQSIYINFKDKGKAGYLQICKCQNVKFRKKVY